jgi:hypothetical protein
VFKSTSRLAPLIGGAGGGQAKGIANLEIFAVPVTSSFLVSELQGEKTIFGICLSRAI